MLLGIGNALARVPQRQICINFISALESDSNTTILSLNDALYERGFELFRSRPDKNWGLVDCIAFVVMRERGIMDVLNTDVHFTQAGFRALLRED